MHKDLQRPTYVGFRVDAVVAIRAPLRAEQADAVQYRSVRVVTPSLAAASLMEYSLTVSTFCVDVASRSSPVFTIT